MSNFEILQLCGTCFGGILLTVLGWLVAGLNQSLRRLRDDIAKTDDELNRFKFYIAEKYATRESVTLEFTALEKRIIERVDRTETWMGKQFDAIFAMLRDGK